MIKPKEQKWYRNVVDSMKEEVKEKMNKEKKSKKRFWVTQKQLNNLCILEHKKSRETLVKEIIKKQKESVLSNIPLNERKKIVRVLLDFNPKECGQKK